MLINLGHCGSITTLVNIIHIVTITNTVIAKVTPFLGASAA